MKQKTLSTLISLIGTFGALPALAETELPTVHVEASQDADPATSYTRASSTRKTPSAKSSSSTAAASTATRVFPTPPTPVR